MDDNTTEQTDQIGDADFSNFSTSIMSNIADDNTRELILAAKNASMLQLSEREQAILSAPIEIEAISIRPDGVPYVSHAYYRRRLTAAFGIGGYALVQIGDLREGPGVLYGRFSLFIRGIYVADAIGERKYYPKSKYFSYASAAEGIAASALKRACKHIGILPEANDTDELNKWRSENAIQVQAADLKDNGKIKKIWRKKTDPPVSNSAYQEITATQEPRKQQSQTTPTKPIVRDRHPMGQNNKNPAEDAPEEQGRAGNKDPANFGQIPVTKPNILKQEEAMAEIPTSLTGCISEIGNHKYQGQIYIKVGSDPHEILMSEAYRGVMTKMSEEKATVKFDIADYGIGLVVTKFSRIDVVNAPD